MNDLRRCKGDFFFLVSFLSLIFFLIGCAPPAGREEEKTYPDENSLLILNSWGTGVWENVPDGKYWFSYNAIKKIKPIVYVWGFARNHPAARLKFKITHPIRDDVHITIRAVNDTRSPIYQKEFLPLVFGLGVVCGFPNDEVYFDITDVVSYLDDTYKTIEIWVEDRFNNAITGTLHGLALELWPSQPYDPDNPEMVVYPDQGTVTNVPIGESGALIYLFSNIRQNFSAMGLSPASRTMLFTDVSPVKTDRPAAGRIEHMLARLTDPSKENYNKVYPGGYGTGLNPPTEEQQARMRTSRNYIVGSNLRAGGSSSMDITTSRYFPPVGNQGRMGSCVSFNAGYYIQTYYSAHANNIDLSEVSWIPNAYQGAPSDPAVVLSPGFLYSMVNGGMDRGSSFEDNITILILMGVSSWSTQPYIDAVNPMLWPSGAAFKEALEYRSSVNDKGAVNPLTFSWMFLETDQDIQTVKTLLDNGYPLLIGVDANFYGTLSDNDIWYEDALDVNAWGANHANTVVGYHEGD
ncbi:MAG TPA: hypothetical protein ENN69_01395 [Spirochaetia bacterium]|nr:hypothetical protein [Spirochaetia bacterium]